MDTTNQILGTYLTLYGSLFLTLSVDNERVRHRDLPVPFRWEEDCVYSFGEIFRKNPLSLTPLYPVP